MKNIKKVFALGLIVSQFAPYMVYATNNTELSVIQDNEVKEVEFELKNPSKSDIKPISYSAETTVELSEIINLLDAIETNFNKDKLKEVFDRVFKLNTNMSEEDASIHQEGDQLDYIMYKASYLVYTKLNGEERDKFFIQLADDMYLSSIKRHNAGTQSYLMTTYAGYWYRMVLYEYLDGEEVCKVLAYLNSMIYNVSMTQIGINDKDIENDKGTTFDENELPSNIEPIVIPDDEVNYIPDVVIDENYEIVNKPSQYIETEEYKAKGRTCYKTTSKYDLAGNLISSNEQKLPSSQKGFCNIYDYEIIDGDTWNKNNNGDIALEVWESLGQNELNKESNNSIYYTLNKNEENPYYYDTGIRVSTDMKATYSQIRDVLNQISLKSDDIYLIEDIDKLLFIAEGKPLVERNKQTEYTEEDILELFESFEGLGLKIDVIKELKTESIEDQATKGELREITFGDNIIELSHNPIVEGSVIKLPIKDVANGLGLTVEEKDDKVIITNDEHIFEYEVGSKNLIIDGANKILSSTIDKKDNVVYGEMTLALKSLGYTLKYDSFNGKLEILK